MTMNAEHMSKFNSFTGNRDVFKWVKKFSSGTKNPKQTNNQTIPFLNNVNI